MQKESGVSDIGLRLYVDSVSFNARKESAGGVVIGGLSYFRLDQYDCRSANVEGSIIAKKGSTVNCGMY